MEPQDHKQCTDNLQVVVNLYGRELRKHYHKIKFLLVDSKYKVYINIKLGLKDIRNLFRSLEDVS